MREESLIKNKHESDGGRRACEWGLIDLCWRQASARPLEPDTRKCKNDVREKKKENAAGKSTLFPLGDTRDYIQPLSDEQHRKFSCILGFLLLCMTMWRLSNQNQTAAGRERGRERETTLERKADVRRQNWGGTNNRYERKTKRKRHRWSPCRTKHTHTQTHTH